MANKGWIKRHRSIIENGMWQGKEPFDRRSAWIDLLLLANHRDQEIFYKGRWIKVKRGEVNRSITFLADRWKWSRTKVKTFLEELEKAKMCTTNCTTHCTTIFIEKYSIYQDTATTDWTTEKQQKDNQKTTERQPKDTYKNNKNYKELKETNNDYIKGPISQEELPVDFLDHMRKESAKEKLRALRKYRDEVNAKWKE